MLTAAFVLLFGMTFLQAVATTKVINVFSSGVATLVFIWRGVVDLKLGVILKSPCFWVHCWEAAFVPEYSVVAADLRSCGA